MQQLALEYGPYLGTFVLAFVAGFVPLVIVDALLVAIAVKTDANLPLVVALAATATLASKLPIYYGVRALVARNQAHPRVAKLRRWIGRFDRYPVIVLALSSTLGLPPFSLVATLAGACEIGPRTFALTVWLGRVVRFAVVVAVARAYVAGA